MEEEKNKLENPFEKDHQILYAEIGKFVVEFEGFLQYIKDLIQTFYNHDQDDNSLPIDILLFDSTTSPLSKYFQAISLHILNNKEVLQNRSDIKDLKKHANKITSDIQEAGELRNDILHASYFLASIYGSNPSLTADRIKITNNGIEKRRLSVTPGVLDNSIKMINQLIYFINDISDILLYDRNDFHHETRPEVLDAFKKVNFKSERTKIFEVSKN